MYTFELGYHDLVLTQKVVLVNVFSNKIIYILLLIVTSCLVGEILFITKVGIQHQSINQPVISSQFLGDRHVLLAFYFY